MRKISLGWSLSTGAIDIVIVSGLLMILMRIAFIIFIGDDCELINIHSATGRMGWDGIWVCLWLHSSHSSPSNGSRRCPRGYVCWFINHRNSIDTSTINHSEIGVTNAPT